MSEPGQVQVDMPVRAIARAEHIGSLLRPEALQTAVQTHVQTVGSVVDASEDGLSELRSVMDDAIRGVVRRQEDIGLDVVSDGEFRRIIFTDSFYGALQGMELTEETLVFRDRNDETIEVPSFPAPTARLTVVANPLVVEARFLAQITERPFKVTLPAASMQCTPGSWRPDLLQGAYADMDAMVDDVVGIEKRLVGEAVEAGAGYVQLDFPLYPMLVDRRQQAALAQRGIDEEALLDRFLAADREVIADVPAGVETALHLCRGNLKSKWLYEGSLEPVAERMFGELPYKRFLIEWDDAGRDGDFSILRFVPRGVDGPVVVLGIISTKSPALEDEDALLRQIEAAAAFLPVEQLAVSPQCGFASNALGNEISEDAQWRKLELVARVAARVW
jgi:5-methyltetrahydropteroyltriglutamate--homocysteine methyltransferase